MNNRACVGRAGCQDRRPGFVLPFRLVTFVLVPVFVFVFAFAFLIAPGARAQTYVIEPDNYPDGTVLDRVQPAVHLTTAGADNLPIPPVPFEVTAIADLLDLAPTGTNVLGQGSVPFWNNDRRLLMEFASPASVVMIDFAGGQYFASETGQLDGYDASGRLVASYVTVPQAAGHRETMIISRDTADIAWAVAYVPKDLGVFGRLDNLRFGVAPLPMLHLGVSNGVGVLTFTGGSNLTYRVWASTDLRNWSVVGTPTQVEPGLFTWADVGVKGNPRKFFRVSLP